MHSRRHALLSIATGMIAAPSLLDAALAQNAWPSRNFHAVAAFPPGTGPDILVRFYANKLQKLSGRTVIVENKVGAFGNIAAEYVARSKPDGYTVFIAPGNSLLAAAPHLFKKLAFDPIGDFDHVTTLFKIPFVLVVSEDSPYRTIADLVDYLKRRGGMGSYGSIGNTGTVASELFKAQFDLKSVEVKYKDVHACLNDLIGGHIAFAHVAPSIKWGKVRALATTTAERFKSLPDIPSASEAGISNSNFFSWWSVHTPKGTPEPILEKLEKWFNEIAVADDTIQFLAQSGSDPFPGTSTMLRELLVSETKAWSEYVKAAKIEPLS